MRIKIGLFVCCQSYDVPMIPSYGPRLGGTEVKMEVGLPLYNRSLVNIYVNIHDYSGYFVKIPTRRE